MTNPVATPTPDDAGCESCRVPRHDPANPKRGHERRDDPGGKETRTAADVAVVVEAMIEVVIATEQIANEQHREQEQQANGSDSCVNEHATASVDWMGRLTA